MTKQTRYIWFQKFTLFFIGEDGTKIVLRLVWSLMVIANNDREVHWSENIKIIMVKQLWFDKVT